MAGRLAANLSRTVISRMSEGRARNVNSYERDEKFYNITVRDLFRRCEYKVRFTSLGFHRKQLKYFSYRIALKT